MTAKDHKGPDRTLGTFWPLALATLILGLVCLGSMDSTFVRYLHDLKVELPPNTSQSLMLAGVSPLNGALEVRAKCPGGCQGLSLTHQGREIAAEGSKGDRATFHLPPAEATDSEVVLTNQGQTSLAVNELRLRNHVSSSSGFPRFALLLRSAGAYGLTWGEVIGLVIFAWMVQYFCLRVGGRAPSRRTARWLALIPLVPVLARAVGMFVGFEPLLAWDAFLLFALAGPLILALWGQRAFIWRIRWFVLLALVSLGTYAAFYALSPLAEPVRSDGLGYYSYLPAVFLDHGLSMSQIAARLFSEGQDPSVNGFTYLFSRHSWITKHNMGVALLSLPFFLGGHLLSYLLELPTDGFNPVYQHAAGLAGLFYFLWAVIILYRLLISHVQRRDALWALGLTILAANLFHYATYDSYYSHIFSFFLFSAFLAETKRWHGEISWPRTLLLGFLGGLIVLTRTQNGLFLLAWPLYGLASWQDLKVRLDFSLRHWVKVLATVAVMFLVFFPQLVFWRVAGGNWLLDTYYEQGFDFSNPHLMAFLFGPQKGLFFWSPILMLCVWGYVRGYRWIKAWLPPFAAYFALQAYISASWDTWTGGGAFGQRRFTESLCLFALGLAGLLAASQKRLTRTVLLTVCLLLAALNIFQMLQYWREIIPFCCTDWEQYKAVFLKWPW